MPLSTLHPISVLSSPCQATKAEALLLRGDSAGQCWLQQLLHLLGSLTLPGTARLPWGLARRESGKQGSDSKEGDCEDTCIRMSVWNWEGEGGKDSKKQKEQNKRSHKLCLEEDESKSVVFLWP